MDARWTSNGCSPLRRAYTTRESLGSIPRDFINAESSEVGCARHSSPNCAQLAFLVPNNYVCVYIYIYISLRWLLNDTIILGWRDRAGRWNGLNSSLKVSLRDLYCYGCVFVRSTAEGSMLNRTKCIAIAKLSRNYSRGGRIISQWGVLPCSYRFLVVRSRVSGSR